jgi:hypothetical protein
MYFGVPNMNGIQTAYYYIDDVCVSTDSLTCFGEVGINKSEEPEQLSFYPNPSTGLFTVQGTVSPIQVYDLLGNLVLRTNKREIDMGNYPSGIYFVRAGEAVRKVVLH